MVDDPTVKRMQADLASALKALRVDAGLSGQALAGRLEWAQPKVSKIEGARQKPSLADVDAWTKATGASPEVARRLHRLAARVLTRSSRSWSSVDEGANLQREIADIEADATSVRNFQGVAIPGLLQTAEYAEQVFRMVWPSRGDDEVARAVAGRVSRQSVLFRPEKSFAFVLAESALRWQPRFTDVRQGQIERLLSIAARPNVTVSVIPFGGLWPAFLAPSFTIFGVPDEPLVLKEDGDGEVWLSQDVEVSEYEERFRLLQAEALSGRRARDLLKRIASA